MSTLRVGDNLEAPLVLPRMAWRYRIGDACRSVDKTSTMDMAALSSAALGLCWGAPGGPPASFEECGRDPIRYGEAVLEWLIERGVKLDQVFDAGGAAIAAIVASLPREEAVQAAADPSKAGKATPTPSSSPSASSGSGTPSTSTD